MTLKSINSRQKSSNKKNIEAKYFMLAEVPVYAKESKNLVTNYFTVFIFNQNITILVLHDVYPCSVI